MTMFMSRSLESLDEDRVLPLSQVLSPSVLDTRAMAANEQLGWFQQCVNCVVNVRTLGQGTAGSGGFVPVLTGAEGFCDANGGRTLDIAGALGSTRGLLFIGIDTLSFPLFGGTFHVNLGAPWFPLDLPLNGSPGSPGAGTWSHVSTSELRSYAGTSVYFQALLIDPGAPRGVTLTNALHWYIGN